MEPHIKIVVDKLSKKLKGLPLYIGAADNVIHIYYTKRRRAIFSEVLDEIDKTHKYEGYLVYRKYVGKTKLC